MKKYFKYLLLTLLCLVGLTACREEPSYKLYPANYSAELTVPGGRESYSINVVDKERLFYTISIDYDASKLKAGEQSVYSIKEEKIYKVVSIEASYSKKGGKLHIQPIQAKEVGMCMSRDIDLGQFLKDYNLSIPVVDVAEHNGGTTLRLQRLGRGLILNRIFN